MPEKDSPLVSVIIPHWKGRDILLRCLASLYLPGHPELEVLLVDNGSTDGSVSDAVSAFSGVKVLRSDVNLGYAGGCNLGLDQASGEFALLLNDDAVVTSGMIQTLVSAVRGDNTIAACQPKILSISNPGYFDYAGAAGGEMDRFGFPFCRGRIFDTVESDKGQYDSPSRIFWASGACCLFRMSALKESGFLDPDFFAHMEEIDLQWRLTNLGYTVVSVPDAIARHDAGSTLAPDRPYKVYLNHRNSLVMLLKNHRVTALLTVLPLRILLDFAAAAYRLARLELPNTLAVFRAHLYAIFHLPWILKKRISPGKGVNRTTQFYSRSIVWDYFMMRRRRFTDLPGKSGISDG